MHCVVPNHQISFDHSLGLPMLDQIDLDRAIDAREYKQRLSSPPGTPRMIWSRRCSRRASRR